MNRRRILLSYLANSFSWELYSKVYFYNELVPTTINGKSVLNKAKIVKVSGNGVIENQLVQISNIPSTNTTNGITFTKNDDVSLTISGTATSTFDKVICASVSLTNGHKYISITYEGSANYLKNWISGVASGETYNKGLLFTTTNNGNVSLYMTFYSGKQYNFTFYPQITDLTLREGTGNEPTTLTDNRIQNILNRGYIAFNLGKYKESDIGVVSSEPYNLFDGSLELGYIADGVNYNSTTDIRSINYVKVFGGKNYTFGADNFSSYARLRVYEFDTNKQYLKTQTIYGNTLQAFSVSNETRYIRFALYNNGATMSVPTDAKMYVHLTGTRTGYAEHKTFTPITFKAQLGGAINSHNTMENTNSAYVFTRNEWKVDLGTLDYQYRSDNTSNLRFISTTLSTMNKLTKPTQPNLLCEGGYTSVSGTYFDNNGSVDKIIRIDDDLGRFVIRNLAYTDSTTFKSSLSGIYAHYPLATPQVITIPKKHLGIVDLGSLDWAISNGTIGYVIAQLSNIKLSNSYAQGIYCDNYKSFSNYGEFTNGDKGIFKYANEDYIRIKDSSFIGKTINEIKALLSGKYLFFETQDEVADIENVVDIESGGTIRANWFRWKENQNAKALTENTWYTQTAYGTLSNKTTTSVLFTRNSVDTTSNIAILYQGAAAYTTIAGHKYLISAYFTPNNSFKILGYVGIYGNGMVLTANAKNHYAEILTPNSPAYIQFTIGHDIPISLNGTCLIENVLCIDLTLGELEDATSIDDPRIQEIIRLGYIPTNTTGTYKEVSPSVLPNIELSVKCK